MFANMFNYEWLISQAIHDAEGFYDAFDICPIVLLQEWEKRAQMFNQSFDTWTPDDVSALEILHLARVQSAIASLVKLNLLEETITNTGKRAYQLVEK